MDNTLVLLNFKIIYAVRIWISSSLCLFNKFNLIKRDNVSIYIYLTFILKRHTFKLTQDSPQNPSVSTVKRLIYYNNCLRKIINFLKMEMQNDITQNTFTFKLKCHPSGLIIYTNFSIDDIIIFKVHSH